MNYLSTKEMSALWEISSGRIALLCRQGRIPGAKLVGKSWMIPADAVKPSDPRKERAPEGEGEHYLFPDVIITYRGKRASQQLSPDEEQLLRAFLLFERGDFAACQALNEQLQGEDKPLYLRVGADYQLFYSYLMSAEPDKARDALLHLRFLVDSATEHQKEYELLLREIEVYTEGSIWFVKDLHIEPQREYSRGGLLYLTLAVAVSDVMRMATDSRYTANLQTHTLICEAIEQDGYVYTAMVLHIYLASMNVADRRTALYHLKRSFEIALEHELYTSLSIFLPYVQSSFEEVLRDYPEDVQRIFKSLSKRFSDASAQFRNSEFSRDFFSALSTEDYRYISFCTRDDTIEDIARQEGISVSTAKNRLSALYSKLGVKNKRELTELFVGMLYDPKGLRSTALESSHALHKIEKTDVYSQGKREACQK